MGGVGIVFDKQGELYVEVAHFLGGHFEQGVVATHAHTVHDYCNGVDVVDVATYVLEKAFEAARAF